MNQKDKEITDALLDAVSGRRIAIADYDRALKLALDDGWSNVRIAKTVNVTEAAVRMYRKRHGL